MAKSTFFGWVANLATLEGRPVWKPLHLQPVFRDCRARGGSMAGALFRDGLCLPSGSNLTDEDRPRVIQTIQNVAESGSQRPQHDMGKNLDRRAA